MQLKNVLTLNYQKTYQITSISFQKYQSYFNTRSTYQMSCFSEIHYCMLLLSLVMKCKPEVVCYNLKPRTAQTERPLQHVFAFFSIITEISS